MDNFTIINRTINRPLGLSDIAVAGDSNSKTITFQIDRFFDSVDLTNKKVRANYINALGYSGSTEAMLEDIEDETFTFSWTIESETLLSDGRVQFGIEFYEVDESEFKIYVWQTKPSFFTVEKGLFIMGDAFPADYSQQIYFYNNNDNDKIVDIRDTNPVIQIDGRNILIGKLEDIVVSRDNLSQILSFKINRYFDDVDLATKKICINFINADGLSDQVGPVNVIVRQLEIEFGWLLDSNVTLIDGNVLFSISFIGYHDNGDFYYWQTKPATFAVEKGLFVDYSIGMIEPSWLQTINAELVRLNQKIEQLNTLEDIDFVIGDF